MRRGALRGIAAVAVLGSLLAAAQSAQAATVTVSGFGDDAGTAACASNVCPSLRDAINAIDSGAIAAGSTIQLNAGVYTLSSGGGAIGDLFISASMTVTGAGAGGSGGTTIQQTDGTTKVVDVSGGTVTLSSLEITGGRQGVAPSITCNDETGGGIAVGASATVALTSDLITGNQVNGDNLDNCTISHTAFGGGIYSSGMLTLTDTVVSNNKAIGSGGPNGSSPGGGADAYGGGIYADAGTLTINAGSITGNTTTAGDGGDNGSGQGWPGAVGGGGGIYTLNATPVVLARVTVSQNTATGGSGGTGNTTTNAGAAGGAYGGGLEVNNSQSAPVVTITDSTFSGNSAAGGAHGAATSYGGGGAIAVINADLHPLTVVNSTITANQAVQGATSFEGGGGISADDVTLASDTIAGNSAPGSASSGGNLGLVHATIDDTIVAGGSAGVAGTGNCDAGMTLLAGSGHNLEDSGAGTSPHCNFSSANGDQLVAPGGAGLGPLASNGGPTQTMALLAGSPAIGNGGGCTDPTSNNAPLTVDQRGYSRPVPCDIGALQADGVAPAGGGGSGGTGGTGGTGGAGSTGGTGGSGGVPTPGTAVLAKHQILVVSAAGALNVTIGCNGPGACSGQLQISVTTRGGVVVAASVRKKAKRARTVIGTAKFSIAAGKTAKLKVTLTRAGRSLLKKGHGKLKVTLTITSNMKSASTTATVKAATVKKKHK
jgi:hypothetical protein